MKKLNQPFKTAFWKVTPDIGDSLVVEAGSAKEALDFVASTAFVIEPYPTDKLVAYIKAGGEPLKAAPKQKRAYSRKPREVRTGLAATVHNAEPQPA